MLELLFGTTNPGKLRELKQLVRDRVAPERDLGHSDRPA